MSLRASVLINRRTPEVVARYGHPGAGSAVSPRGKTPQLRDHPGRGLTFLMAMTISAMGTGAAPISGVRVRSAATLARSWCWHDAANHLACRL
jgi:hypothetical protein